MIINLPRNWLLEIKFWKGEAIFSKQYYRFEIFLSKKYDE